MVNTQSEIIIITLSRFSGLFYVFHEYRMTTDLRIVIHVLPIMLITADVVLPSLLLLTL